MGIVNRTKDLSEQKESLEMVQTNVANGTDIILGSVERSQLITDCRVSMLGVSGSPTILLRVLRFVAGTGGSTFSVGSAFTVSAFGTSGTLQYSLPAAGSSLLLLQKGDILVANQAGGASAASTATVIDVVVQNLADIKTWY